jgi:DNA-binding transcriptional regulator YiaG
MSPSHIKIARCALGWSQERLAREISAHPKTVAYWERQKAGNPDGPMIKAMREAFARYGVTIRGRTLTLPKDA